MARPTANDVHVEQPLSNISIAYRNETYYADQIFPVVTVENKTDDYFRFSDENKDYNEFMSIGDDVIVNYNGKTVRFH